MKKILLIAFVLFATSCSYSHRGPASSDLEEAEFDSLFNAISSFSLKDVVGKVFICDSMIRAEHEDEPEFSMVGMFPFGGGKVVVTMGDGTNKGTKDSLASLSDSEVVLTHTAGEFRLRYDLGSEKLLINAYAEIDGKEVITSSHVCAVRKK